MRMHAKILAISAITLTVVSTSMPINALCAEGAQLIKGVQYRAHNPFMSGWEDDGTLLTDGIVEPSARLRGGKRKRSMVIYSGGTVVIDLQLPSPCAIDRIVAHVYRPNMNYKLRFADAYGRIAGFWKRIVRVRGFWGRTQRTLTLWFNANGFITDELRLVFYTPHLLALTELQVFGIAVKVSLPDIRCMVKVHNSPAQRAIAREVDINGDGQDEVILENRYLRIVFYPHRGGVAKSMIYKPTGKELIFAYRGGRSTFGAFRDQLWYPRRYFFAERRYDVQVRNFADRAVVELSVRGKGGMMNFTTVRKRFTLFRNASELRIEHELINDPNSQTDYEYGFWVHNFFGAPGETNTYFIPTENGIVAYRHVPGKFERGKNERWYYNPSRGWIGFVSESGTGMIARVEFRYLNCFYHWTGAGCLAPTLEWRFNRLRISAGDALHTTWFIYPFATLRRIDGAFDGIVGAIVVDDEAPHGRGIPFMVQLHTCRGDANGKRRIKIALSIQRLPNGGMRRIAERNVTLRIAQTQSLNFELPPQRAGALLIRCAVIERGKVIGTLEHPIAVGGVRIAYHMKPEGERIGIGGEAPAPTLPRHELSTDFRTEHVRWAKPLLGKPIRALVLTDDNNAREVIELWQRIHMQFAYVKFLTLLNDRAYLHCGDRSIASLRQARERLKEILRQRFDVIVIGGLLWNAHFDNEIRRLMLEQVRNGCGFVYIAPLGIDDDLAQFGIFRKGGKRHQRCERWRIAKAHPLVNALPYDAMPTTRHIVYDTPPDGDVLLRSRDGCPILVITERNGARMAALNYDVFTHDLKSRHYAGLTPCLSIRNRFFDASNERLTHHYWEYWFALLARIITWAGHRDSTVVIESVDVLTDAGKPSQQLKQLDVAQLKGARIAIKCRARKSMRVRCHVIFRDKWHKMIAERTLDVQLRPPMKTITLELPSCPHGLNLVDVIVRDADGNSLAWGAGAFEVHHTVRIATVAWKKREIAPNEAPILNVAIDGNVMRGAYRIRTRILDAYERLLAVRTEGVPADENPTVTQTFTIADPIVFGIEARIELLRTSDGATVDTARVRALIIPHERRYDRLHFTSWTGQFKWRSKYLFRYVFKLVQQLGLDCVLTSMTDEGTGRVWDDLWHGMRWCPIGLLDYIPNAMGFRDRKFHEKVANYKRTKDRRFLIREPCLNDSQWRQKVIAHMRYVAGTALKYGGGFNYCMGDEMSLTYYTAYHDYCFSEHCLRKLRNWLKRRYGTLAQLNRAWGTNFKSWSEVMPMTADEVRTRKNGNYAPWADHRTFMEDVLADFYREITSALRSVDTGALAGLSGTQAPEAGNGMDWWKLSQAFQYYHSYNTAQSSEMRRSFQTDTGVMQSPYHAGYWLSGGKLESRIWWCLLHDTIGISAWTTRLFFYNDFTFSEAGRDTRALINELKDGIWQVVRHARRLNDGIAIHYSQPSVHGAFIIGHRDSHNASRNAWVDIITDCALQFDFVAYAQVEMGILRKRGYKVLIMPESVALSPKECDAITDFVRNGGWVIADNRCGIMDEHCRMQNAGMLDELFGIARGRYRDIELTTGITLETPLSDALSRGTKISVTPAEVDLRENGARAYAIGIDERKPRAIFIRRIGKGGAVYLNLHMADYLSERQFGTHTELQLRELVLALLRMAGVTPTVRIAYEASGAHEDVQSGRAKLTSAVTPSVAHCEVVRYADGNATYIGVIREHRDGEVERILRITLPRRYHVYDVRAGRYIGHVALIRTPIASGRARLYALLVRRYDARMWSVDAPSRVKLGERVTVRVRWRGELPNFTQVFHISVHRPDGSEFRQYSGNILLSNGSGAHSFRIALNDPTGIWRIRIRHVPTGSATALNLRVR